MRDEFYYFTSLLDFQEKRIDRNMHLWKSIYCTHSTSVRKTVKRGFNRSNDKNKAFFRINVFN